MVYELNGKGTLSFTVNTFAFSNTTHKFQGNHSASSAANLSTRLGAGNDLSA
jgi:hypothetical protein